MKDMDLILEVTDRTDVNDATSGPAAGSNSSGGCTDVIIDDSVATV